MKEITIDEKTKQKAIDEFRLVLNLSFQFEEADKLDSEFYEGYIIGERVQLMKLGILTYQDVDRITNEVHHEFLKNKRGERMKEIKRDENTNASGDAFCLDRTSSSDVKQPSGLSKEDVLDELAEAYVMYHGFKNVSDEYKWFYQGQIRAYKEIAAEYYGVSSEEIDKVKEKIRGKFAKIKHMQGGNK